MHTGTHRVCTNSCETSCCRGEIIYFTVSYQRFIAWWENKLIQILRLIRRQICDQLLVVPPSKNTENNLGPLHMGFLLRKLFGCSVDDGVQVIQVEAVFLKSQAQTMKSSQSYLDLKLCHFLKKPERADDIKQSGCSLGSYCYWPVLSHSIQAWFLLWSQKGKEMFWWDHL